VLLSIYKYPARRIRNVLPKITSHSSKEHYNPTTFTLAGDTVTSHSNDRLIFACAPTEHTQFSFRSSPSASTAQSVGSSAPSHCATTPRATFITCGVGGFFDVPFKLRLLLPFPGSSEGSVSAGLTSLTSICEFCDVGIWSVILRRSTVMLFVLNTVMRCEKT
jgi:hypothetical protein